MSEMSKSTDVTTKETVANTSNSETAPITKKTQGESLPLSKRAREPGSSGKKPSKKRKLSKEKASSHLIILNV